MPTDDEADGPAAADAAAAAAEEEAAAAAEAAAATAFLSVLAVRRLKLDMGDIQEEIEDRDGFLVVKNDDLPSTDGDRPAAAATAAPAGDGECCCCCNCC